MIPRVESVFGFHGCSREVADVVLRKDGVLLNSSENDYDWLGSGIYFWESAPVRAMEWATKKYGKGNAAVVGAKINLGRCLDLMDVGSYQILKNTYQVLLKSGMPLPKNGKYLHKLDCLVINIATMHSEGELGEPYDTVRCPFVEGEQVFPGSCFYDHSHIQISVRNPSAIVSLFPVELDF